MNKFILLLRKGVCPWEYMENWQKFNKSCFSSKEKFYSDLNIENMGENDFEHAKNVWNTFEKKQKNLGNYHDLYDQCEVFSLSDSFETCYNIYDLDSAHFYSAPGLTWIVVLKITNIKLELLTGFDMLLIVESGIRCGICCSVLCNAKANNEYMKNYNENKESSNITYLNKNIFYGFAMSQRLLIDEIEWRKPEHINEDFIKNCNDQNKVGYIFQVDLEQLSCLHHESPFLPEDMVVNKTAKLICNMSDKKMMYLLKIHNKLLSKD